MLRRTAALAPLLALLASPVAAAEDARSFFDEAERFLRRIGTQYAIVVLRTAVDITYDSLAVDIRSNDVVLTGVQIRPPLDWDRQGDCVIGIERVRSGDLNTFSRFRSVMQVSGVTVPSACFQPQQAAMLASFGFDGIIVDSMALDIAYDFPTSGAEINLQAAIRDAGDLTLSADFDYLFFQSRGPMVPPGGEEAPPPGQDMAPVAWLDSLEISFRNDGLFQRVEPLLAQQVGDVQALPQMAQAVLVEALSEGGARALSAEEQAFVQNVTAEVGRFVRDKDRLVISVAPEGGVLLTEQVFGSPVAALAALEPVVSSAPAARRSLMPPARIQAALSGGADLSDDERLAVGRALVTGDGAPRAPAAGAQVLKPLAEAWNGEANLALARTATGAEAYRLALRALAAGAEGAIPLADELETALEVDQILSLQREVAEAMPPALAGDDATLLASGDIGDFRARASDLAAGTGAPRSYRDAYYWATLAAAAGDRISEALMTRLDASFGDRPGGGAWEEATAAASDAALRTWIEGGLGQRLATGAGE